MIDYSGSFDASKYAGYSYQTQKLTNEMAAINNARTPQKDVSGELKVIVVLVFLAIFFRRLLVSGATETPAASEATVCNKEE